MHNIDLKYCIIYINDFIVIKQLLKMNKTFSFCIFCYIFVLCFSILAKHFSSTISHFSSSSSSSSPSFRLTRPCLFLLAQDLAMQSQAFHLYNHPEAFSISNILSFHTHITQRSDWMQIQIKNHFFYNTGRKFVSK